jgi:hypothetical protein
MPKERQAKKRDGSEGLESDVDSARIVDTLNE